MESICVESTPLKELCSGGAIIFKLKDLYLHIIILGSQFFHVIHRLAECMQGMLFKNLNYGLLMLTVPYSVFLFFPFFSLGTSSFVFWFSYFCGCSYGVVPTMFLFLFARFLSKSISMINSVLDILTDNLAPKFSQSQVFPRINLTFLKYSAGIPDLLVSAHFTNSNLNSVSGPN